MNMQAMLKQAQALQKEMLNTKAEIDATDFEGESSFLKVTVKGNKAPVINANDITIKHFSINFYLHYLEK